MGDATDPNIYSDAWFDFFHIGIPAVRTEQETAFVRRHCPLPDFARVLDVCCGLGRHARGLAAHGYTVMGVERDERAVQAARGHGGGPVYLQCDVREYRPAPASFDAVVILSQSFGYYDPETNRALLARLVEALRAGGRVVLDLWNPDFFFARQGPCVIEMPAGRVLETKRMENGRLLTQLDYPGGGRDAFDFQTFTVAGLAAFAQPSGLMMVTACTDFDEAVQPSADKPKIQFVLERG